MGSVFEFKSFPEKEYYLAPDKSEIRKLLEFNEGGLAHCRLHAGQTSNAVKHKTVREIWYCLAGTGKMWQERPDGVGCVKDINPGDSLLIPLGNSFQFQNTGNEILEFIISTMPKWPEGVEEAMPVEPLFTKNFKDCIT